ncbi:MAG: hypothetical protein V7K14_14855 [Nostoc sp.]
MKQTESLVGKSEGNVRRALKTASAIAYNGRLYPFTLIMIQIRW